MAIKGAWSMINNSSVVEQANSLFNHLIEWRRQLHQYPELSFKEYQTAEFITRKLYEIPGMNVEIGLGMETSVIGTISNGDGPTVAVRADIDALPIREENNVCYSSKNDGVMHACGHDAHTAIVLGVAKLISKCLQNRMKGTVKFIFQPAEESTDEHGLSGSPYLVKAGVYDDVDAAIALHMCPWLPVGEVQINDGYSMANVDVFNAKIVGTGGHGAYPELGTDPIWMLGPVMQAIHSIVSRRVSSLDFAVISIGKVQAGTASNIIPTEVFIEGTIRSYKEEVRDLLASELQKAFSIVGNFGGSYTLNITRGEPALNNDPIINDWIKKSIKTIYPQFKIHEKPFGMGGEDFGYVTQKLPSAMFFLGCATEDGVKRELHTPIFDLNEKCLPMGVAILTKTIENLLTDKGTIIKIPRNGGS
jgi:amidohydrolase